jgi:hypothetical protein
MREAVNAFEHALTPLAITSAQFSPSGALNKL